MELNLRWLEQQETPQTTEFRIKDETENGTGKENWRAFQEYVSAIIHQLGQKRSCSVCSIAHR